MSYELTLEKAGAKVIDAKYFGSYQGTWGAIVEYEGKKGLVLGSYGSCSGCDAFQAEFGWNDEILEPQKDGCYYIGNRYYDEEDKISKEKAEEINAVLETRYAEFGKSYLHTILDKWDIENRLKGFKEKEEKDDWFDNEEKKIFEWALNFFVE